MARIKIKDIPKDMKITKEEMKRIIGGLRYRRHGGSASREMDYLRARIGNSHEPIFDFFDKHLDNSMKWKVRDLLRG